MATQEDNLEIELEGAEESFDENESVEIVDDTPEEDRNRTPIGEVEVPDDEINQYSENVQKRIKELRRAYHDERREKERFLREQQEAINYAKSVYQQNKELRDRLSQGEQVFVETSKKSVEAQLAQAEHDYKEAYESGDTDKLITAQKKLSEILASKRDFDNYRPRYQQTLQNNPAPVEKQQPKVVPDERTRQWVSENQWFDTDPVMRGAAFGIHDELVRNGYSAGSDAYFKQIDARIRESFPHKFRGSKPASNVVAPASRASNASKRVKLTKTQVAIAKRLGVPLERYAEQVAKEMENG